ncbi:tail fiber protein, partial [Robiginitalea sp.]|nr:tail fiber protein [Robiginitalea sp.]
GYNDLYLDLDSGDVYKRISVGYTLEGNIKGPASSLSFDLQEDGDLITFDGTNWVAKSATLSNTGGSVLIDIRQPSLALHYQIALNGIYPYRSGNDPYIGEIALYTWDWTVRGWATCQGQLMAISQNTALFSLLGTTYGGDGRTTFGLPDLRGRVAVGIRWGPGLSNYQIGQKWGSEGTYISVLQMPSHSHTIIYQ